MDVPTLLLLAFFAFGAQQSPYAAAREQALAPALDALHQKQYEQALQQLERVLQIYPNDSRVLMLAGNAARGCHRYDRAASAYQAAIAHAPGALWPAHFSLVQTFAALGQWEKFDAERQLIEKNRLAGDPYLAKVSAYVIDEFDRGPYHVRTVEYLQRLGRFHTHYRFFIEHAGENPIAGQWTPHFDCESDDIDQVEFARKHPSEAAAGLRSASLDAYMTPHTHGTIKLYTEGEPSYQAVRQDVIEQLSLVKTKSTKSPPEPS